MWPLLTLLVIIDGIVVRNPQPWAAPIRAGLIAAMVIVGLALLWRTGIRIQVGSAAIVGILAALVVSDFYQRVSFGISTWIIYAGAYCLQRSIKRDWRRDFAITGIALTCLALVVVAGTLCGVSKPGPWHRNEMGGIMAALLPAATTLPSRRRWIITAVIGAGVLLTTSRGAALGTLAGLAVIIHPLALAATPVIGVVLALAMRQFEAGLRFYYWLQAINMWRSSIVFGVGPGLQLPESGIHAHNTLLGLATQVGLVGIGVMLTTTAFVRRIHLERWQLATLAVVAVHGLVDDPLCWLPVGVVLSLALVENATGQQHKSV